MSLAQPRILVRGVNWLGDAVIGTPALQRLRQAHPQARISLLCHQKLADLWLHFPVVDHVISFTSGETPWSLGRRLHSQGFDTALVFPNSPRSALEAWFARIPQRVGYAQPWRNWLLTQPVASRSPRGSPHKRSVGEIRKLVGPGEGLHQGSRRYRAGDTAASHQMHEYLHLVAQLGGDPTPLPPLLAVTPEEVGATASKFGLEQTALIGQPILALNPGAEYGPAKRWPVQSFVAAAAEIQRRASCALLILGAQSDIPLAKEIHSALRAAQSQKGSTALKNLAGQTSLRELMGLLKLCRVLLTNDTGPMHVAAALGTRVVVPFGSTSPELTGPGVPGDGHHHLLLSNAACTPCFRRTCPIDFRCMTGIPVEAVVVSVLEAFADSPDPVQRPTS